MMTSESKSIDWTKHSLVLQKCSDDAVAADGTAIALRLYLEQPDHVSFGRLFLVGRQRYPFRGLVCTLMRRSPVIRSLGSKVALNEEQVLLGEHIDMDQEHERSAFLDLWVHLLGFTTLGTVFKWMTSNELVALHEWSEYLGCDYVDGELDALLFPLCMRLAYEGQVKETHDPRLPLVMDHAFKLVTPKPISHSPWFGGLAAPVLESVWMQLKKEDDWKKRDTARWTCALARQEWKTMHEVNAEWTKELPYDVLEKAFRTQWENKNLVGEHCEYLSTTWVVATESWFDSNLGVGIQAPEDVRAAHQMAVTRAWYPALRAKLELEMLQKRPLHFLAQENAKERTKWLAMFDSTEPWKDVDVRNVINSIR